MSVLFQYWKSFHQLNIPPTHHQRNLHITLPIKEDCTLHLLFIKETCTFHLLITSKQLCVKSTHNWAPFWGWNQSGGQILYIPQGGKIKKGEGRTKLISHLNCSLQKGFSLHFLEHNSRPNQQAIGTPNSSSVAEGRQSFHLHINGPFARSQGFRQGLYHWAITPVVILTWVFTSKFWIYLIWAFIAAHILP
jgi:hypothetical protein